ncbi:MAG: YitT family protein [Christensenellales bacterium]|jgi:uncharacterized membrane-anchored protein YitT (DUF2179 family)|nr:YitT family protein [Clostridiales bacterium]
MRKKFLAETGFYGILLAITFVRALATYVFIIPNSFAPGGVSGISSIVYNIAAVYNQRLADTVFNPGVVVFILNIPLMIWAFKVLDKRFAFSSMVSVALFAVFMMTLTWIKFPQFIATNYESGIMLLAALAGGAINGLGLGIMLRMNTSMGGTDTLAKIIYKKNSVINVQWLVFFCDCVVVLMSGILGFFNVDASDSTKGILVKVLSPVLYSFISLFIASKAADIILVGFESSVVFNIITSKPKEIGEAVVNKIKRGGTILKGEGIYTKNERTILICVVSRKQIIPLKKLIKEIDQSAFSYVTDAREVNGYGFRTE